MPGAICYCLQRNKYDQSLRVMDIYILKKIHYFMLFRFLVMGVESEEEEEGGEEDE